MQANNLSPVDLGKLLLVHNCCSKVCSGARSAVIPRAACSRAGVWFAGASGALFLLMAGGRVVLQPRDWAVSIGVQ